MEARRKGVVGRMVVTRNRRSNSGRSSRARRYEGMRRTAGSGKPPFPRVSDSRTVLAVKGSLRRAHIARP